MDIPLWVWSKLHLVWHMALLLSSAFISQNQKYAWLGPVLQAYGQITPPPEMPVGK